jgi:hypothetical protein
MLVSVACAAVLAQPGSFGTMTELPSFSGEERRILLAVPDEKLDPPKPSPRNGWLFEWVVNAYGRQPNGAHALRFRVFSQERKAEGDRAPLVARMLMRLWDFNVQRLNLEHAEAYNNRIVDVYLTWGGKAGGEQRFDEDTEGGRRRKVNTIYIYDLASFTDPVEMAREVAHEYGHAVLPPVGGFREPEDWGNGVLGERLYLRWLRDEMRAGRLKPADAMGAELPALDAWVRRYCDALAEQAARFGPRLSVLAAGGPAALDAYVGVALLADATLPRKAFGRSLRLTGSTKPTDYPAAVVAAVEESQPFEVRPPLGPGQAFWMPLGASKATGAKVLQRAAGWAKVQPTAATVRVVPPGP